MSGIFRTRIWLSGLGIAVVAALMLLGTMYTPSWLQPTQDPAKRAAGAVASESKDQPTQSSDSSLEELAMRLLGDEAQGMVLSDEEAQEPKQELLVGKVPESFPFTLPNQEGWRLIGSFSSAYNSGGALASMDYASWNVAMDAPGSAQAAIDQIKADLTAQGWQFQEHDTAVQDMGGFKSSTEAMFGDPAQYSDPSFGSVNACRDGHTVTINIRTVARKNGPIGVNLDVRSWGMGMSCSDTSEVIESNSELLMLPKLRAPEGAEVWARGFSGGTNGVSSSATAQTTMSARELEAHYATQLEAAGWTRTDGSNDQKLVWSLWSVPSEEDEDTEADAAYGFLYVLEEPGRDSRSMMVSVSEGNFNITGSGMLIDSITNEFVFESARP